MLLFLLSLGFCVYADVGQNGHHGDHNVGHHEFGCHMDRGDRRSITFSSAGSVGQCTSTHSTCVEEKLDFTVGCNVTGCFMHGMREISGDSYEIAFPSIAIANVAHQLGTFQWGLMTCQRVPMAGIDVVICNVEGTKRVSGSECRLGWRFLLPESGTLVTSSFSCRPDTMKLDVSFTGCLAPHVNLTTRVAGPDVGSSIASLPQEVHSSVMDRGMMMHGTRDVYFSWNSMFQNQQTGEMMSVSTTNNGADIIFQFAAGNSTSFVWDPKLAISRAQRAGAGFSLALLLCVTLASAIIDLGQ